MKKRIFLKKTVSMLCIVTMLTGTMKVEAGQINGNESDIQISSLDSEKVETENSADIEENTQNETIMSEEIIQQVTDSTLVDCKLIS